MSDWWPHILDRTTPVATSTKSTSWKLGHAVAMHVPSGENTANASPAMLPIPLLMPLPLIQNSGVWVQGSGFRVQESEFRVQGSGFRAHGPGFRVQVSGRSSFYGTARCPAMVGSNQASRFREGGRLPVDVPQMELGGSRAREDRFVQRREVEPGLGFDVWGVGFGVQVLGLGFKVEDFRFKVEGFGFSI